MQFFNDLREGRKEIENVTVNKTPKYLNFHVILDQNDRLGIYLSINPDYEGKGIQFWGLQKYEKKIKNLIKQYLPNAEILPTLKTQSGKFAKWQLKGYSTEKFEKLLQKLGKI
jgi:hypothetical protein